MALGVVALLAAPVLLGLLYVAARLVAALFGVSEQRYYFQPSPLGPLANIWVFLVACVAGVWLVFWFYLQVAPRVRWKALLGLVGARGAALVLAVLLLFQPAVSCEIREGEKPALLLLVDKSRSMSIADYEHRPGRFLQVRHLLGQGADIYRRLREDFAVHLFVFDRTAWRVEDAAALAGVSADGEATVLGDSFLAAARELRGQKADLAVLFSDGIDNSGTDPVPKIQELGCRVYTVGVGTRLRAEKKFQDVRITDVVTPRTASAGEMTEVTVYVDADGFPGTEVTVVLEDPKERQEAAAQHLFLDARPGIEQSVKLRFKPEKPGACSYLARVAPQPGERITENNRSPFLLNVIEPKIKVLYVDILSPERKFLYRTLQMDPGLSVICLTKTGKGAFVQQPERAFLPLRQLPERPEELEQFDVLVVGNLHASHFNEVAQENWKKRVAGGAGFLLLAGEASFGPGGYGETQLAEVLPVRLGGEVRHSEFRMELDPAARAHPILAGCEAFFDAGPLKTSSPVPPFEMLNLVAGPKPGAQVLAYHPQWGTEGTRAPVLVVQHFGRGRSAALCAAPTWKWYLAAYGLGKDSPYVKFWSQLIRWLAAEEARERGTETGLRLYTNRAFYRPGEEVLLYAYARDPSGLLTHEAQVTAEIILPGKGDKQKVSLAPVPERAGLYEFAYHPPTPGSYHLTGSATLANEPLGGEQTRQFEVGRPNLEYEHFDLNETLLRRIATETKTANGYFPLSELENLMVALKGSERQNTRHYEYRLYNPLLFFLLFLGLVTLEWLLRKRYELA